MSKDSRGAFGSWRYQQNIPQPASLERFSPRGRIRDSARISRRRNIPTRNRLFISTEEAAKTRSQIAGEKCLILKHRVHCLY